MKGVKVRGFPRQRGVFGIRNRVLVMATVSCVNSLVEQICRKHPFAVPVTHQHGCDHLGDDKEQVVRTMAGVCSNPNVGGVLLVGLGCEAISAKELSQRIETKNRLLRTLVLQEIGDKKLFMKRAAADMNELRRFTSSQRLRDFNISRLVVGLNCGGSDPFSGITANPAVGVVADKLVQAGATVMLAEIPEMIGAGKLVAKRARNASVGREINRRIGEYVACARKAGCDLLGVNPTPGNIAAGISSIEEKSIGCFAKGGSSRIQEFIPYGSRPTRHGLVVMDTPGNDAESVTGLAAGGAHLILFTTGLGTPLGNAVSPVLKIASNSRMFVKMRDFLDLDAGPIAGGAPAGEIAEKIYALLLKVCCGAKTASERNGCFEFAVNRIGVTF